MTDAKSVFDYLHKDATSTSTDKRMAIEAALLRETVCQSNADVRWLDGQLNISNVLTKANAEKETLREFLKAGKTTLKAIRAQKRSEGEETKAKTEACHCQRKAKERCRAKTEGCSRDCEGGGFRISFQKKERKMTDVRFAHEFSRFHVALKLCPLILLTARPAGASDSGTTVTSRQDQRSVCMARMTRTKQNRDYAGKFRALLTTEHEQTNVCFILHAPFKPCCKREKGVLLPAARWHSVPKAGHFALLSHPNPQMQCCKGLLQSSSATNASALFSFPVCTSELEHSIFLTTKRTFWSLRRVAHTQHLRELWKSMELRPVVLCFRSVLLWWELQAAWP